VRIGNSNVTSIGGQVGWSNFSDGRYKKNIKDDVQGLSFINSLRPITYTVDINGLSEHYDKGGTRDSAYDKAKALMKSSADKAAQIVYNGFIAQEVEAAAKKLNYTFSGVDKPQSQNGLYGLRYADFVVPLVKAVQELSQENAELKSRLDKIEAALSLQSQNVELGKNAKLEQNVPNPYSTTTTISYSLPSNTHNAYINFYASNGAFLKSVKLAGTGKGTINVTANELPSGAYRYSLIIDGKVVASKQMAQAK
jgi:hypothetical protein